MPQDSPAVRPSSRAMLLYRWWPTLAGQGGGVRAPAGLLGVTGELDPAADRKSTRLNSSHGYLPYAVFCLKKKNLIGRRQPKSQQHLTHAVLFAFLPPAYYVCISKRVHHSHATAQPTHRAQRPSLLHAPLL